jgi:tyrosinase
MKSLIAIGIILVCVAAATDASAASPQFIPAYPLYCQGPLTTGAPVSGETTTPFVWAATGAGAAAPGPGQCSWADRAARGSEIQGGGGNVICDYSSAMQSVPAGAYVEVGVARDPLVGNCMHLAMYLGTVSPPFSATPALPPFVRQSIASLSAAQITSLQHGIQVMMSRSVSDPTSYRFQANIHGTLDAATTPEEIASWNNCEHGSYFFLSWHRMYLYFFDRILRAAAGDPNLVLPYWNWADPAQRTLPSAFRIPASASNPLYIAPPGRPTALDLGTASLGAGTVDYSAAFTDTNFDSPMGSGASFGGQIAPPMQFNAPHSDFEGQPHDVVHVALGGLMSSVDTAAQDPIFWLHHANIDRLWNHWIAQGGGRTDATDAQWLNTTFTFYDEAGHAVYLTGAEIIDTVSQLNYRYDDDPLMMMRRFPRLKLTLEEPLRLIEAVAPNVPRAAEALQVLAEGAPDTKATALDGKTERLHVPLAPAVAEHILAVVANNLPGQIYLRFDDIRYDKSSGVYYEVYVSPPPGEKLDIRTPGYAGNLALFGLKPHSMDKMRPEANAFVEYDISHLVREAIANDPKGFTIVLVPRGLFNAKGEPLPVSNETQGTLGGLRILGR